MFFFFFLEILEGGKVFFSAYLRAPSYFFGGLLGF